MTATLDILLVEDNPADVRIVAEALKGIRRAHRLHVARDGIEAMAFLRRRMGFEDKPRPDLVLLDVNMPRKDGHQVLKEVKQDPQLRRIPVVMLTSSAADVDVLKAYDLHANAYVVKPIDLDSFVETLQGIDRFWAEWVRLPERS